MRKFVIFLFLAICLSSIVWAPAIIYGSFRYAKGEPYHYATKSTSDITYEQARKLTGNSTLSPDKSYSHYRKIIRIYKAKYPFWLSSRDSVYEEGALVQNE
jgi:hypothetical protein